VSRIGGMLKMSVIMGLITASMSTHKGGNMARRKTNFETSARFNNSTFKMYYNRMLELAYASIKWENLPDTVDERYLEISLNRNASAILFTDPVIGEMALTCLFNGNFDAYGNPVSRRAYSYYNIYQRELDSS